jgi:hypothetical protein
LALTVFFYAFHNSAICIKVLNTSFFSKVVNIVQALFFPATPLTGLFRKICAVADLQAT